jgi:hypothetical protein
MGMGAGTGIGAGAGLGAGAAAVLRSELVPLVLMAWSLLAATAAVGAVTMANSAATMQSADADADADAGLAS